ncbi:hypothetical protein PR048_023455 [Dryococelus australis]|uniref:Uncharacterized protein n=1 Tax=Dryococelus australis TaxID=614101 RepID=A0ABQ9GUA1_9NEOP|nr:hypothetical protein PR048_023455 [Dryococelus australis]
MKIWYDRRMSGGVFKEGQMVWLCNPQWRKGYCPKLKKYWEGPYRILKNSNLSMSLTYLLEESAPRVFVVDDAVPSGLPCPFSSPIAANRTEREGGAGLEESYGWGVRPMRDQLLANSQRRRCPLSTQLSGSKGESRPHLFGGSLPFCDTSELHFPGDKLLLTTICSSRDVKQRLGNGWLHSRLPLLWHLKGNPGECSLLNAMFRRQRITRNGISFSGSPAYSHCPKYFFLSMLLTFPGFPQRFSLSVTTLRDSYSGTQSDTRSLPGTRSRNPSCHILARGHLRYGGWHSLVYGKALHNVRRERDMRFVSRYDIIYRAAELIGNDNKRYVGLDNETSLPTNCLNRYIYHHLTTNTSFFKQSPPPVNSRQHLPHLVVNRHQHLLCESIYHRLITTQLLTGNLIPLPAATPFIILHPSSIVRPATVRHRNFSPSGTCDLLPPADICIGNSTSVDFCITAFGVGPLVFVRGSMNTDAYLNILDNEMFPTLWRFYGMDPCYFQDDNARCHVSRATMQWYTDNNVRRLDWPVQSPDLNPIKHLWDELDRRVRARQARPKSIAQLMEWLQEEWRQISVDALQTLVESMPERVAAVIAARVYHTLLCTPDAMGQHCTSITVFLPSDRFDAVVALELLCACPKTFSRGVVIALHNRGSPWASLRDAALWTSGNVREGGGIEVFVECGASAPKMRPQRVAASFMRECTSAHTISLRRNRLEPFHLDYCCRRLRLLDVAAFPRTPLSWPFLRGRPLVDVLTPSHASRWLLAPRRTTRWPISA